MTLLLLALVGTVVGAAVGMTIPWWLWPCVGTVMTWWMVAQTPDAVDTLVGLWLSQPRPAWADRWLDAGLPLGGLPYTAVLPVGVEEFAAYTAALGDDRPSHRGGGFDPGLIGWFHAHHLSPETVSAYRTQQVTGPGITRLHAAEITPEAWSRLRNAIWSRTSRTDTPEVVIPFVNWLRTSRATLLPSQFAEEDQAPARTVEQAVAVAEVWGRRGLRVTPLDRDSTKPLDAQARDGLVLSGKGCDVLVSALRQPGAASDTTSPEKWADAVGMLAPYFRAAGIGFADAVATVHKYPDPTPGQIDVLAALR